jgi:predicted AAA+ superfamily ATPase
MYIHQFLLEKVGASLLPGKVVVLYGPRRIGKTTLLNKIMEERADYILASGEDIDDQAYLSSQSIVKLKQYIGRNKLLIIDEAQKIPNIGLNLKLIVDHCPEVAVLATGSSAFELANQLGQPLTGRKITFRMYPLSQIELNQIEEKPSVTKANLESRLIYGSYPEVVLTEDILARQVYLSELTSDYLYTDILELDKVRKSQKISELLSLLAFQVGKAVSKSEVGQQLGLNKQTVDHYLDLLEKAFVIIPLSGFSRNLRKEVSKSSRYYFYDNGVRNALINQFQPLSKRNDIGELWENYLIVERIKKQHYQRLLTNNYFWRTYDQQEIDWVEESNGELSAFEFKYNGSKKAKVPIAWNKGYPGSSFCVISQENYLDFIV